MSRPALEEALGLDIGGLGIKAAFVRRRGESLDVEAYDRVPLEEIDRDRDGLVRVCLEAVARAGVQRVRRVGLALPGPVRRGDRRLVKAANLERLGREFDLRTALAEATGLDVRIENDANVFVWGEWRHGVAKGRESVIGFTLGTGIGGGLIVDRRLVQGFRGFGGELGHICYLPDGELCGCGARGCIEQYASTKFLLREGRRRLPQLVGSLRDDLVAVALAEAARGGLTAARALFDEMGRALGTVLAGLLNALDVEALLFGGGLVRTFDLMQPAFDLELRARSFAFEGSPPVLLLAPDSDRAGAVGAAVWALDER